MTHILVVGAGIGGLTAALALAEAGLAVSVIERAPELREAGAGLQISPNASVILGRLGLLDALRARAVAPKGIRICDGRSGATLSFLSLEDAEARWGAPYLVVHRADLQHILAEAVRRHPSIALHVGTALAGFGTTGSGVTASARQGALTRSFTADALIGADGVRSLVRARLVAEQSDEPTETGRNAWRALVPAKAVDPRFQTGETGLWLGRDAHLVHYPTRGGDLINVVAVIREGLTDLDMDALWATPGDREAIARRFARWHPAIRTLIAAAPHWLRWPLFDRKPLAAWNAGPVALLGDAAHPILPFLAQGAAQAIEDAAALALALSQRAPIAEALASYSRSRQDRVLRVQETGRQLGRIYHLAGPAALARNLAMRAIGPRSLLSRYDWLYGSTRPNLMPA